MPRSPHPELLALLQKHDLTLEQFWMRGCKAGEYLEVRRSVVTDLHQQGTTWDAMKEITGLSHGSIQRLTRAMWNGASRSNRQENMRRTARLPEVRALKSEAMIQLMREHPERLPNWGKGGWISVHKESRSEIYTRSSYERKAVEILEADTLVQGYEYEPRLQDEEGALLPDFLVSRRDRPHLLLEVKPEYVLRTFPKDGRHLQRLERARQLALRQGWDFAIWTEAELGL